MKIDPITLAVIKNALDAIVDEVAYTVLRTARSEIVKDVMDYSATICDASGNMIAQAKTIALHLGAVPEAMSLVLAKYGNDLHEGDAIILNDPYQGGMHLPDIFMFTPIFLDGVLEGFSVVICHHTDVGGRVPGSNAADSTEIFQEGLRIPILKYYDKGVLNEALHSVIELNVRVPDRVLGDLKAQLAACHVGAREMGKLISKYGCDTAHYYFAELLDYAERLARDDIRSWPDGVYRFTDYIDDDGFNSEPLPIAVAITVQGDGLIVDYEGSSAQVPAALNATKSYTNSCTYLSVRCILNGDIPNNQGIFRCIEVRAPKASILNPDIPSACAARALTGYRVMDAMMGALTQIVPDRVPAAGEGGNTVVAIGGYKSDSTPFIIVDMICGCWGGRPDKDGVDAITNPSQNLSNTPVEVLERQHPVRIEDYSLITDSCGAGEYRGGLGVRRSYRLLADTAGLQLRSDRTVFAPFGLAGGEPGRKTTNWLVRNSERIDLPGKVTMPLKSGEMLVHEQAGAGGFGSALNRSVEKVLADLQDQKITPDYARKWHGVVLGADGVTLDQSATDTLRREMRSNV